MNNERARDKNHEEPIIRTLSDARARDGVSEGNGLGSKFDDETLMRYVEDQPGVESVPAVFCLIQDGRSDVLVRSWLEKQSRRAAKQNGAITPMPGQPAPETLREFLTAISALVNGKTFDKWFKPITDMSRDENRLYLRAQSEEAREWIRESYSAEIGEALEAMGLDGYEVRFV